MTLTGIAATAHAQKATRPGKAPNIIFILADDQGYGDLGVFYQNQRARLNDRSKPFEVSPNIDRMAGEGTMLTQYYVAAPICAPSRASLMLGVSQGHANVRDNEFDKALDDNYTLPGTLRQLGYSTAIIGKWGLEGNDKYDLNGYLWPAHPLRRGFDYFFGYMRHADGHEHYPKEALYRKYWAENGKAVWQNHTNITSQLDKCYTADLWTAAAKKYIVDHICGREKNKPFFLYLAFETPHAVQELPTQAYPKGGGLHGGMQWLGTPGRMISTASGTPDSYTYPAYADALYDDDGDPSTPEVHWPSTYQRYATANHRIDDAVGDMLQLLKDLKIDSNTMVVYTSDNGPSNESYLPEDRFPPNKPTFFRSFGPFEGIKADTWEGGVRVPAIVRWPGHVAASRALKMPAIAYDWAPTFIGLSGQPPPERMDGVSLLPALTGKGVQQDPTVYIEYKNDGKTPDYSVFSASHRGRARNQTQLLRLGNYVGVRYDVKSAADDFEIYNVIDDPAERNNLAGQDSMKGLQQQLKARALQLHHNGDGSPRPYDNEPVPGVNPASVAPGGRLPPASGLARGDGLAPADGLAPGVDWAVYNGPFPWIPQVSGLTPAATGYAPYPSLVDTGKTLGQVYVFSGYIMAPADGEYHFFLTSDTKAFLRIHDIQVIDADYGYPGGLPREATIVLKKGLHPFRLSYHRDHDQGEPFFKLDWNGPGETRKKMGAADFFRATR
ncbi:MAG: sulfatase-like hydrolase/transferase [Bacteroidetes bacterium]|nr:sulfatase-like hydrolase/transferase [Bacteroidota bacterium]